MFIMYIVCKINLHNCIIGIQFIVLHLCVCKTTGMFCTCFRDQRRRNPSSDKHQRRDMMSAFQDIQALHHVTNVALPDLCNIPRNRNLP